jgi:hypothetical protein
VIALDQLRALGLSEAEIKGRLERGSLLHVHHGVYAVGHGYLTDHARLVAALLAAGPSAFLSHRTAAALWRLRALTIRWIDVTVPGQGRDHRDPLILHRTRCLEPEDVVVIDGLRVSSVPRTLIDCAAHEHPSEVRRLVTQAIRKEVLDLEQMQEALQRHRRRKGVARKLRPALAAYEIVTTNRTSPFEYAFDDWLAEHPEIPQPVRNVTIGHYEIDCYWPVQRLAVELDGREFHIAAADFERDRVKDAYLQKLQIRVLRITPRRFRSDRRGVHDDLLALLEQQRAA